MLATDKALGRLFTILRRRGLYDKALIVVLSGHGEEFLDHDDFGHGPSVYQELARVPLLIRLPASARAGLVITQPVGLVDVAPTVLDLAGLPIPAEFAGHSLRRVIEGNDSGAWLAETPIYIDVPDVRRGVAALRLGAWKLVRRGERFELYDLERDPHEARDLADEMPERVSALRSELDDWLKAMYRDATARGTLAVPSLAPHPAEQEAALRALGYVE